MSQGRTAERFAVSVFLAFVAWLAGFVLVGGCLFAFQ
jgi:hypothetical protein